MAEAAVVAEVYALLAEREYASGFRAYHTAKAALAEAQGSALLALLEAIAHVLDDFLTELAEHGVQNQALWRIDTTAIDVAAMTDECAQVFRQAKVLRASGVSTHPSVAAYVGSWISPIGSRAWESSLRLAVAHRSEPGWVERISQKLG